MSRIYLLTRAQGTVGVLYNDNPQAPQAFQLHYELNTNNFYAQGLHAVNSFMEMFDLKKNPGVHVVYVPSSLLKAINNENWKYWLATGKDNEGNDIEPEQLEAWGKFAKLWQAKGLHYIFKSIGACKVNDIIYNNKARYNKLSKFVRDNNYYIRFCMEKADERYGESGTPAEPEVYHG